MRYAPPKALVPGYFNEQDFRKTYGELEEK
jgi:hypothetical protein